MIALEIVGYLAIGLLIALLVDKRRTGFYAVHNRPVFYVGLAIFWVPLMAARVIVFFLDIFYYTFDEIMGR